MARVLIIAYTYYVQDGRVKRHAQALAERGDEVDVVCLDNAQVGMHKGVNVVGLTVARYQGGRSLAYLGSYLHFFVAAAGRSLRLARRRKYDLVIVCTMPDAAILAALPLKLLGSKIVLDIHDTMPELYRDKFSGRLGVIGERVLRTCELTSTWFADRVLAVHEPHRRRLTDAGVRAEKIAVVLNTPDQRLFAARSDGNGVNGEQFTIVCHGTITERLALDVALVALAKLRARGRDIKLKVIGAGDHLQNYKTMAAGMNLQGTVEFQPSVSLERLPEIVGAASLGLIPNRASRVTNLMLPAKLLEYVTLGVPVVAARLATITHYFDKASIKFFEPGNSDDLADAIEELYPSASRRLALAMNARRDLDKISWQRQRECFYAAIDPLLAGARQAR
jgi:glycosyltransferase involved in cell wall biosynthesis